MDLNEHLPKTHGNGIVMSPLTIIVLGLLSPIVGSIVKDRIVTGESSSGTAAQVQVLQDQLRNHLQNDSVHRAEFSDLQKQDSSKVTQDEFRQFETRVEADLAEIKEMIKGRK